MTEGLSNIVLGEVKPLMVMSKFGLEDYTLFPGIKNSNLFVVRVVIVCSFL